MNFLDKCLTIGILCWILAVITALCIDADLKIVSNILSSIAGYLLIR